MYYFKTIELRLNIDDLIKKITSPLELPQSTTAWSLLSNYKIHKV